MSGSPLGTAGELDGIAHGRTLCSMAHEVIQRTLEDFTRGLGARPTGDPVSITVDGRRLDSKTAVLDWWGDVAADVEAEEAAVHVSPGG